MSFSTPKDSGLILSLFKSNKIPRVTNFPSVVSLFRRGRCPQLALIFANRGSDRYRYSSLPQSSNNNGAVRFICRKCVAEVKCFFFIQINPQSLFCRLHTETCNFILPALLLNCGVVTSFSLNSRHLQNFLHWSFHPWHLHLLDELRS